MQKWKNKINNNKYFIVFIILFAYTHSVYMRIILRQEINAYLFTPEAAIGIIFKVWILYKIINFSIKNPKKTNGFSTKELLKIYSISVFFYVIAIELISLGIAVAFNNVYRNFNSITLAFTSLTNVFEGLIYGSFCLVYYYYMEGKKKQQQLNSYQNALSESKISQLKAQLNPHFLFNNLNVLDQLIEEDKNKASAFLNEFAEIYRYVLQASDKKMISIKEELIFAAQYFKLLQYKYESAYQLIINCENNNGYIVPLTIQLLIENALQHNLGTKEMPIVIKINIAENIVVTNNLNFKKNKKYNNGKALKNLSEQYSLLTKNELQIIETKQDFIVIIPKF